MKSAVTSPGGGRLEFPHGAPARVLDGLPAVHTSVDAPTYGGDLSAGSGFYNASFTGTYAGAGLATQGTRLVARFENVPPGVSLFVTQQPIAPSPTLRVQLITTGAKGEGSYQPVPPTANGYAQPTSAGAHRAQDAAEAVRRFHALVLPQDGSDANAFRLPG